MFYSFKLVIYTCQRVRMVQLGEMSHLLSCIEQPYAMLSK